MNKVAAELRTEKWKTFAIQLGLTDKCVSDIGYNHKRNVTIEIFTDVFHEWHTQQTSPYTWNTVVEALRSPSMDERGLAEKISRKFLNC